MPRFSKKADILSDPFIPYEEAEEHGRQEISIYTPEYEELIKLIKIINSKVPEATQDIKNLATAAKNVGAFNTLDDLGDLKAQIWTLAVNKYNIPREWLISKLFKKKASLKQADLWPAQAASECTLSHPHNSLSYNPLQEPDLSVSGPNPTTPLDLVKQEFLIKHSRWSEAVKALRAKFPNLTDEDIASLKMQVKATLSSLKKQAYHALNDLTQFALDDKQIQQHFKNRGTTIEDVIASLPNFTIKYTPQELEKQDPSLKDRTKGFYNYNSGTLYVNPRISLDAKRITIIHEIEHALQDSIGELPVHTPEDLQKVKQTPYEQRTFELGAKQQQFNALKQRGMSLDDIVNYWMKRYGYPEYSREELRNELEQFEDIYEEMMPESIMASKIAKKKSLNIDKVVQVLNSKEPKVVHVDPIKALIELEDGSIITFNQAVDKALEIGKTGVFSGAEFSTTEFNVNPTLDLGPYSSPQDEGAGDQIQPWPNTEWIPADDKNEDEEPYSDIASNLKKPFSKKADFSGHDVNVILKGIESSGKVVYNLIKGNQEMFDEKYTFIYPDRENVIDGPVDFDIVEGYIENNKDLLQGGNNSVYAHTIGSKVVLDIIKEQLPAKAISKKELNIVKKADESPLTQEDQNEISAVSCPAYVIAVNNYYDAVKRGHSKDRALAYAVESVANLEKIDEKKLVEFINTYL